jgi:hypothetical protein
VARSPAAVTGGANYGVKQKRKTVGLLTFRGRRILPALSPKQRNSGPTLGRGNSSHASLSSVFVVGWDFVIVTDPQQKQVIGDAISQFMRRDGWRSDLRVD